MKQEPCSAAGGSIRVVEAAMSDFTGTAGTIGRENAGLFRSEYVPVRRSTPRAESRPGLYTDPLVPFINPQTGRPIEPFKETRERWGDSVITTGLDMYALPFGRVGRSESADLGRGVRAGRRRRGRI